MKNKVVLEMAMEQHDADALRGSMMVAMDRHGANRDVLAGMIISLMQHTDAETLSRWIKDNLADEPSNPDTNGWREAWMRMGRVQ